MGKKKRKQSNAVEGRDGMAIARRRLQAGLRHHREGRLADAQEQYRLALESRPDFADALHFQGLASLQMSNGLMGLETVARSVELAPDRADFQFNLGNAYRGAGRAADATLALRRAAELSPGEGDYWEVLAQCAMEAGDPDTAKDAYERVLALQPMRAESLRGMAVLCYEAGNLPEAKRYFDHAVHTDPSLLETMNIGYSGPDSARCPTEVHLTPADDEFGVCTDQRTADGFAERLQLHIVDDFLDTPLDYRERALALPFHESRYAGQNYPGIQTAGQPCQSIMDQIAALLGKRIRFRSPDNGCFRVSFADSIARTDIHADNETYGQPDFYAAVLYLNLAEQCRGGTAFWRHKETGWERRPTDEELSAAGYADFKAFRERWQPNRSAMAFEDLRQRRDAWEPLFNVAMRNNRLIAYRADYFHSISEVFGATPNDGRLVQLFYFEAY